MHFASESIKLAILGLSAGCTAGRQERLFVRMKTRLKIRTGSAPHNPVLLQPQTWSSLFSSTTHWNGVFDLTAIAFARRGNPSLPSAGPLVPQNPQSTELYTTPPI